MRDGQPSHSCRVVLAGWYGAANFGDELLLATIAGWIHAAGGTPIAISVHPSYTKATLGIEAVPFSDLAPIVEAMAGADLFVLGGGGLFQDYDGLDSTALGRFPALNATQYAQYFHLAAGLGLPTVALAQGIGPLRTEGAQAVAAEVFRRSNYVSLRDAESAQLLRDIAVTRGAPVAPDPGWLAAERLPSIDLHESFPQLTGRRILGINLRHWPFDAQWEEAFVAAIRGAVPKGWGCLWIDFQRTPAGDGQGFIDDEIAPRMIERLGAEGLHVRFNGGTVPETVAALAACDAVLAMRLHGVLVGHSAGRPVVALEYDEKVRALNDELGVPPSQRMPLGDISNRLHNAIHIVTGEGATPFVLPRSTSARLSRNALTHRQFLWDAMSAAMRDGRAVTQDIPQLLHDWLKNDSAAASRILAPLARRRAEHARDAAR